MLENFELKRKRPLANRIYCGAKRLLSAETGTRLADTGRRIVDTGQEWIESGKEVAENIENPLRQPRQLANRAYCTAKRAFDSRKNLQPGDLLKNLPLRRRSMPQRAYRKAARMLKARDRRPFAGAGLAIILIGLMAAVWYLISQQESLIEDYEKKFNRTDDGNDDLKLIEGIGPKVEVVLKEAGVMSLAQLGQMDAEDIRAILRAADLRFLDPSTWPEQARLAASGDWTGLEELNNNLRAGRR